MNAKFSRKNATMRHIVDIALLVQAVKILNKMMRKSAPIYRALPVLAPVLALTLGLTACTTLPPVDKQAEPAAAPAMPEQTAAPQEAREIEAAKAVQIAPVRPKIELSEALLYELLLAEFAGHNGELATAAETYLSLAQSIQDHKLAERATRIAVYAREDQAAAEAATLWADLDPLNPDPHQVLAVMELRQGNMEKTVMHLQSILDYSHGELDQKLWMIANMLGRERDAELVLDVMEELVATHHSSADALYAFAHVAARLGDLERSRQLFAETLVLAPGNDNAALSYISVLQKLGEVQPALQWLEQRLANEARDNFNLRMAYARLLAETRRYDDARQQFELLAVQSPANNEVLYALGLLYLQSNRLDDARVYFERLTEKSAQTDNANYYLGRISEEEKNYPAASGWYEGVHKGENYFDARIRLALLQAKLGDVEKARQALRLITTANEQQMVILVQAEAELLLEEKRYHEALEVYNRALTDNDNTDLLYARAMVAEKLDRLDIVEADLRRILAQEPDHASALNALGYTLADRTARYDEAYGLIKQALALNPADFYILDSMGWVLYRLGRLDEAITYLKQAMALRQDPEIAAHLGEVLWVKGDKEAARAVWESALKLTPDDAVLLDVIKRFQN